jgi:hypothetical protein
VTHLLRHHYELLERIHRHHRPRRYVEIGVAEGYSLAMAGAGCRVVGIDPEPKLASPPAENATLHPLSSDDYFAGRDLTADLAGAVDLAFVDGLHHFDAVLRDVLNLERHCIPTSAILLHDTVPIDAESATRERRTLVWTGDVWRAVLALREARPDLAITTLDVPPSGVTVITGLDPESADLPLDELVARYLDLPYEHLDGDRDELLALVPGTWPEAVNALPDPWGSS